MQELEDVKKEIMLERENDLPPFVLIIIGLLIIGCGLALFQWVNTRSPAAVITNQVSGFSQPNLVESVGQITRHKFDNNLAGATVLIEEAPVWEVLGDYVFLVGSSGEDAVPVTLLGEATARQPEVEKKIRKGQSLRIFGILLPLHHLRRISDPDFISATDARQLESKDFYISGIRVDVVRDAEGERMQVH